MRAKIFSEGRRPDELWLISSLVSLGLVRWLEAGDLVGGGEVAYLGGQSTMG